MGHTRPAAMARVPTQYVHGRAGPPADVPAVSHRDGDGACQVLRGPNPRVSLVIPARNEARNLEVVLPQLPEVYEVVLVDGHSEDDTITTARHLFPGIRVVQQTRTGKGNALACGFLAASGDVIVMFDADGSASAEEIPVFVSALVDGADFARGSRFRVGGATLDMTWLRALGNSGLNTLSNTLFPVGSTDLCYGYNAFWRDIVPVLDLPPVDLPSPSGGKLWGDGFEIETLINCRVAAAGLRVAEVGSVERRRIHGGSNLRTFADGARVLRTLVAERRRLSLLRRLNRFGVVADTPRTLPPRTDLVLRAPSSGIVPAEGGGR